MITFLRGLVVAFLVWEVFICCSYAYTEQSGRALIHLSLNLLALVVLLQLWWRDARKPTHPESNFPTG
jgi:hypothetical protein